MNTHTQKTWIAGTNTLVVTVPKFERESQGIEEGDFIETTFKLIKKKSQSKKVSKKKLIQDNT